MRVQLECIQSADLKRNPCSDCLVTCKGPVGCITVPWSVTTMRLFIQGLISIQPDPFNLCQQHSWHRRQSFILLLQSITAGLSQGNFTPSDYPHKFSCNLSQAVTFHKFQNLFTSPPQIEHLGKQHSACLQGLFVALLTGQKMC